MRDPQTVVVLGGGVGGVVAAQGLRKRLAPRDRVVLVDRERDHLFAPSLLWLMVGRRRVEAIRRPLSRLSRRGIEVRTGEITRIDPEARQVVVGSEVLRADHLVVSLGAELAPELIPGLSESGENFYTLPGAERFHRALATLDQGRIVILTAAPAYKCPAAPYEAALLIDHFLRQHGRRGRVSVEMFAAEPTPMAVAGAEVSGAVKHLLEEREISYHPAHQLESADPVNKRLTFANRAFTDFDLLAFVPPHRPPRVVRESGLSVEGNWVSVDRRTLQTRFPAVYAIGDVVSIPLALGKPLPKAGVFAHGQAEVVARNIAAGIAGRAGSARYDGHGQCFIEIGGGKAAFGGGDFYAEPTPAITLAAPGRRWHLGKVLLEKLWLHSRF